MKCSFAAAPVANAKMAVQRIEKLTGIRLVESQCRRTMMGMGVTLKRSAPLPGNVDEQLQLEFYTQGMIPRLEQADKGESKVFFDDAAHFVLGGIPRPHLSLRPALHQNGFRTTAIQGAWCSGLPWQGDHHAPHHGQYLCAKRVRAACRQRQRHPHIAITLIMNNARYQRCERVREQAHGLDIERLFLPAYSTISISLNAHGGWSKSTA